MPEQIVLFLSALVTAIVVEGLKALSNAFGKDLTGYATVVAAVIVSIVVFSFNTIVAALPKDWQASVAAFLALVLTFLGAGGLWRVASKRSAA